MAEHDPFCPIRDPEAYPICLCGVIARVRTDQHLKTTASTIRDISEDIAQAIETEADQGMDGGYVDGLMEAVRIARSFGTLPVDSEPDHG